MSDLSNPSIPLRSTPQWGSYQRENFWKVNESEVPPFNTDLADPEKLEERARERLGEAGWHVLRRSSVKLSIP
ncbi:hypothetical protein MAP00_004222 [Monascus purpureus]|nr:hypothetical protein MAP00_004222 [Monascus purpureus]